MAVKIPEQTKWLTLSVFSVLSGRSLCKCVSAGILKISFYSEWPVILWLDYWSVFNMSQGENKVFVVILIYFENYFISQSLQHIHSFGFIVCVRKQFLDKLILPIPICDEKINKIALRCTKLISHHHLVKVIRLRY